MRGLRTALVVAVFALTGAFASSVALADEPDLDRAAEEKRRGDEAMDAGRAAEALAAYRRAASIAAAPSLEYNIGRALLAIGDFAGAIAAFERYDATAPEELKRKTHRLSEVMAELRTKVSTLEIAGARDGSQAYVRGQAIGALPLAPLRLNPGRAEVRVEREGFVPFVTNVDLMAGGTVRVVVVQAVLPDVGRLAILARPEGARITIDGASRGLAPVEVDLSPGTHEVVASATGREPRRSSVTIVRGETKRIDVELAPERRAVTSRWWFWTGLGIVAAGAAVTVFALTTERGNSEGSLGTYHVP